MRSSLVKTSAYSLEIFSLLVDLGVPFSAP